jgi:VWFA-related protein
MTERLRVLFFIGCLTLAPKSQQTPAASNGTQSVGNAAAPRPVLRQRPLDKPGKGIESGKVQTIKFDVVVTDATGKPVTGLAAGDFTVTENGQLKTMASFHEVNGVASITDPVQAVVLIDTVNNSFESVAAERSQIEKFLGRDGGHLPLPVSIVLLSDNGATVDQPSRDGNLLIGELRKTFTAIPAINGAMGAAGSIDRFQRSLKVLNQLLAYEGARGGRKLLLWIGPGWPMLEGAHFSASERDTYADWQGIVNFSTYLRQARVTLYSIETLSSEVSVPHAVYYQNFLQPVTSLKQTSSGNLSLQVLAIQSGGRVFNASNDLVAEISRCLKDAKSYYSLSFDAAKSEQANEYRSLEVKVTKPGLTVRTNSGYYAQPGSF